MNFIKHYFTQLLLPAPLQLTGKPAAAGRLSGVATKISRGLLCGVALVSLASCGISTIHSDEDNIPHGHQGTWHTAQGTLTVSGESFQYQAPGCSFSGTFWGLDGTQGTFAIEPLWVSGGCMDTSSHYCNFEDTDYGLRFACSDGEWR